MLIITSVSDNCVLTAMWHCGRGLGPWMLPAWVAGLALPWPSWIAWANYLSDLQLSVLICHVAITRVPSGVKVQWITPLKPPGTRAVTAGIYWAIRSFHEGAILWTPLIWFEKMLEKYFVFVIAEFTCKIRDGATLKMSCNVKIAIPRSSLTQESENLLKIQEFYTLGLKSLMQSSNFSNFSHW